MHTPFLYLNTKESVSKVASLRACEAIWWWL